MFCGYALDNKLVKNIGWCATFGAFLPKAIPSKEVEMAKIGVSVCSVFYTECMARYIEECKYQKHCVVPEKSDMNWRIDAYFLRSLELSGQDSLLK